MNLSPNWGNVKNVEHDDDAAASAPTSAPAVLGRAARQAGLRTHNLALVLEHVARAEHGVSRAAIAKAVGLTRATVSTLVDQLLALGLVEWAPAAEPSGVGRPAAPVRLARGRWAGLGLEVGANHLAARVVDLAGRQLALSEVRGDFAARSPRETLDALARLGRRTWDQALPTHPRLAPLGVAAAVPGIVRAGVVLDAPRLGWTDLDAAAILTEALSPEFGVGGDAAGGGSDVVVANEASLAALAESHARGPETFLYVSAGVGVGGAYVVDGQLQGGVHGFASELGHVTVDPAGPRCRCGATGCLEQYAGATALAGLGPAQVGRALGIAIAGAVNVLDVGRVVLGGTLLPVLADILPTLESELATRVLAYPWAPVRIEAARVRDLPGLQGAALVSVLDTLADPERLLPEHLDGVRR